MARKYHITPQGPRPCSADPAKPNSRGCAYGDSAIHFDNMADAMETYQEGLQEKFGEFHVLIRPSVVEKGRRLGYQGLDGVEKVKASPQVTSAVSALKTIKDHARQAIAEIREQRPEAKRTPALPETIATRPLVEEPLTPEEAEAEAESRRVFVERAQTESGPEYRERLLGKRGSQIAPRKAEPEQVKQTTDLIAANASARRHGRRRKSKMESLKGSLSRAGISTRRMIGNATDRSVAAGRKASSSTKAAVSNSVLTSRAAVNVAKRQAAEKMSTAGAAASKRMSQMSIPAGHIRPGDTFDGTIVHSVEQDSNGKVKIRYKAKPGGPLFSATVDQNKAMRVDRKTRREARNSRISNSLPKPISRTELSSKIKRATSAQIQMLKPVRSELRFEAIEVSMKREQRAEKQRELVGKLKAMRNASATSNNPAQSAKIPVGV